MQHALAPRVRARHACVARRVEVLSAWSALEASKAAAEARARGLEQDLEAAEARAAHLKLERDGVRGLHRTHVWRKRNNQGRLY